MDKNTLLRDYEKALDRLESALRTPADSDLTRRGRNAADTFEQRIFGQDWRMLWAAGGES